MHLIVLPALLAATGRWASTSPDSVAGRVLSDETSEPIAGASVGIQGSQLRVITDDAGGFQLPLPARADAHIVAWKQGYYIAGTAWNRVDQVSLRLRKHPAGDDVGYQWLNPGPDPASQESCANCHAEIYRQWSASSHARSAVNRHFHDVFYGTDWTGQPDTGWNFHRDQPDARAVCTACHLPEVPFDNPVAEDPARARGITREGIHCDYCHKVADSEFAHSLESLGLQHGRDALRLVRPSGDQQVFFGPFDDVDRGRDTFAPLYRSSVYCASCHEGTLFGTRAYETYSEWRASPYAGRGIECQNCHMKPGGATNMASGHGGIERDPATLSTHQFPGSNDDEFLRSSVQLTLDGSYQVDRVRAEVTVRPVQVGHRLPTGSPDRHLILVLRASNGAGRELSQIEGSKIPPAGGVGPQATGHFDGMAGKLYGKLLRGQSGSVPAPFWNAVAVDSDSRLQPDQPDQISFAFQVEDDEPVVRLKATLLYRRFYKPILDTKGWPDADVVLAEQEVVLTRDSH